MNMFLTTLSLTFVMNLFAVSAFGEIQILEIALSRTLQDREPLGQYAPPAFCEKDREEHGKIPIVNLAVDHHVVFWNKITSTESDMVRHTWHHKGDEGWTEVAQIDMEIAPSKGYRIWSTKDLLPALHHGEWMIVVALASNPKQILCISRFLAQ